MAIERHIVNEQTGASIWAESANLNYFVTTPIEPVANGGIEVRTKNIPQRTVRRYVGDPSPYTIPAVNGARYLFDPGRRSGSTTPGKEMILDDGTERRAMTYTGSFVDIHAYILGDASMALTLYSEGAPYLIPAPDAGGQAV